MRLKTSKISAFRLWALLLTLGGMGLMILGTAGIVMWGRQGQIIVVIFMVLGLISMMASMAIYFWAGMMSTSTISLECPECGKTTKMLGRTDRCMFCRTILTFDPEYASKDGKTGSA